MKVFSKFLEEWDIEIIWSVLLGAVCATAIALTPRETVDAAAARPAGGSDEPPIEVGDPSGLSWVIANQGNLALRQIRSETQQDSPTRLKPVLPPPGADMELVSADSMRGLADGLSSAGPAPSAPFR